MTNLISEVKAALQAATPGPWKWISGDLYTEDMGMFQGKDEQIICDFGNSTTYYPTEGTTPSGLDIRLIVNSPTWLQQLIDCLETAERQREEAVKALEWYGDKEVWTVNVHDQWQPFTQIGADKGELARTTLKRIKGENSHE